MKTATKNGKGSVKTPANGQPARPERGDGGGGKPLHLFATVMTHAAPSANYRGESENSKTVIQKVTIGNLQYPMISPEAIRNALREQLAAAGLPCNRTRLHSENELAVEYKGYNDPDQYADDFLFGYMIAAKSDERKKILAAVAKEGRDADAFEFRRESIFQMNIACGLEPFRDDTVFSQSPAQIRTEEERKRLEEGGRAGSSLLKREVAWTAYQYPFALNMRRCMEKPEWTEALLRAIAELSSVAGNHARSLFHFDPAGVLVRLTSSLAPGYNSYAFDAAGVPQEVIDGLLAGDYPGAEFHLGGECVKKMGPETVKALEAKGVTLDRSASRLLAGVYELASARV